MPSPTASNNDSLAIVGAGLAGLTAAREAAQAGMPVSLFDKGRGVGGRMSIRRGAEGGAFDHGAQYFTARDERFAAQVAEWVEAGVAAEWEGKIGSMTRTDSGWRQDDTPGEKTRYVGSPGMNAPAKALAEQASAAGATIATGVRVAPLKRAEGRWRLVAESGEPLGDFDRVLVTAPAPQAAELLMVSPALSNAAKSAPMAGGWAVMAEFDERLPTEWDGVFLNGESSPLSWATRDSSKPGREAGERWVLHGSHAWTAARLDLDAEEAAEPLLAAWLEAIGCPSAGVQNLSAHLWRFAAPDPPLGDRFLCDRGLGLYAAGDWCGGPRVEGAYLSGLAATEGILAR